MKATQPNALHIPACAEQVDIKHLERLMCCQAGFLPFAHHQDAGSPGFFNSDFQHSASFLPLTTKDQQHYKENLECTDKEYAKTSSLTDLLTNHTHPIEVSRVVYEKPIAVVYNPVSGSKRNIRKKIQSTLQSHFIEAEFFETTHSLHAWDLVESVLDLNKYGAIAVAGGDGLFHEVINGLMNRTERIPVGFLPNGTGNDTVANFGVTDLEQALEFLVKGDIMKMDCNLITLDANSTGEVPYDQRRDRVRYSVGSSAVGFIAHVNRKAAPFKAYMGKLAYTVAGLKELVFNFGPLPRYDIELELPSGSKIQLSIETLMLFINNGKYAGGHANFTPGAILNDGLLDVIYKEGSFNVLTGLKFINEASQTQHEGSQVFRNDTKYLRAKSIVVSARDNEGEPHLLQIDGENFVFEKSIKVDSVPGAIDVIVDAEKVLAPTLAPRFVPLHY